VFLADVPLAAMAAAGWAAARVDDGGVFVRPVTDGKGEPDRTPGWRPGTR
jgi:hypothetical protein